MSTPFLIGCNYWASNAGTEMWKQWDPAVIRQDLKVLSEHGISCMRVFPNWRDFQPVTPIYGSGCAVKDYRMADGTLPTNPEFLDETMLARFAEFCDICNEFGMHLIVGLITGFMSGQTYLPSALYGKSLFSDPTALLMQQRYVRGFVSRFKSQPVIYAWDLGNECNNLGHAQSEEEATNWSLTIANAIRAADPSRPIISGMHGLVPDKNQATGWTIAGQAEACDILTTHPYPYWVTYADQDPVLSFRTAMHATFETVFYSNIGNRPCLVEELGTMGPMVCAEDSAADFMRVNLFSNWVHGSEGVLWWCANEQTRLRHTPYTYCMCETELGMRYADGTPKPVLLETGRMASLLRSLPFSLSAPQTDAVCLTTWEQPQWGVAYIAYCLAKQAGLTLSYAHPRRPLPSASVYMLPSLCGSAILPQEQYLQLLEQVRNGAMLYISNNDGILSGFEELTGLKITDSCVAEDASVTINGVKLPFSRKREFRVVPTTAEVLATDSKGLPVITANTYGKGRVLYVNFPLEMSLLHTNDFPSKSYHLIYRKVFESVLQAQEVATDNPFIGLTRHAESDGSLLCAAINYSAVPQVPQFRLLPGYTMDTPLYGDLKKIPPFDACFFRIRR